MECNMINKKTDTIDAILAINPDAEVTICGNSIDWGGTSVISQADIDAKIVELEAEWTAQEYARNRKDDYPNIGEQLNKIYDDGLTKWKAEMVDPVKTKWPKDNSGPV